MTKKEFLGMFEEALFCPGLAAKDKTSGLTLLVDSLYARYQNVYGQGNVAAATKEEHA